MRVCEGCVGLDQHVANSCARCKGKRTTIREESSVRFEYVVDLYEEVSSNDIEKALKGRGLDGWELVSFQALPVVQGVVPFIAIYKRELE